MKILGNLRIGTRLHLLTIVAAAAVLALAAYFVLAARSQMLEQKQLQMRHIVESAHAIVVAHHAQAASGKVPEAQAREAALAALRAVRYGTDGYIWVNDMRPYVVMHPIKPELDGKDAGQIKDPDGNYLFKRFVEVVKADGAGYVNYLWPKPGYAKPVAKVSYVQGFAPWGWVIGSGVYADDVDAAFRRNTGQAALVVGLVVAGLVAMAFLLGRSITRPLQRALSVAQAVAAGDLTAVARAETRDETGQLLRALAEMTAALKSIVEQVRGGTETMFSASKQIATSNGDLSQRTEEQASSLEETASSMEELTGTVKQNAESARQANQLAAGASEVAVKGGEVVGQVVSTMSSINESSRKIVDIISVIDGIAFQTNILALNAAVEAARAGEQGRGFAVVASEVRTLAQRSAAAAKEIKLLITDSVDKVGEGSRLVDEAGRTMGDIVDAVKRVTDIMGEISAASQEQSAGIEQVSRAVTQMDDATQQNAALVEEAAAAAESLEEQAKHLAHAVSVFRLEAGDTALAAAFDFVKAARAHNDWKYRLGEYLRGKGEKLDAVTVSADDRCPLGGWIHGAGKAYAACPEHGELRSAHAAFHRCAGEIVSLHDQGDAPGAKRMLEGDFAAGSKATLDRLYDMQRAVAAGPGGKGLREDAAARVRRAA